MQISLSDNQSDFQIKSYEPGTIQINQETFTSNVIIAPDKLIPNWELPSLDHLSAELLQPALEMDPEIFILGTGAEQKFPHPSCFIEFIEQKIGYEIMSSESACRTYQVLTSENRRVVAAIII